MGSVFERQAGFRRLSVPLEKGIDLKVAFLCLGVMGYPMAGHLARSGQCVTVYNRTASRAEDWQREFAQHEVATAPSPAEAVKGAEFVFVCTGNDSDLRQVLLGDSGALDAMSKGACLVDHTTASAELARVLSEEARQRDLGWLDAPVSGGEAGAQNGALTIMVGGDEADYQRASSLLDVYARKHLLMGPAGSGQLTKMVNQICIGGLLQALSEGLSFAERVGLDGEKVVEVIAQGAAGSWQMENRSHTMLKREFDFGFALEWMRKDLGMALAEAARAQADLPVTALVDQFYAELESQGHSRWDTSSLITLLDGPASDAKESG